MAKKNRKNKKSKPSEESSLTIQQEKATQGITTSLSSFSSVNQEKKNHTNPSKRQDDKDDHGKKEKKISTTTTTTATTATTTITTATNTESQITSKIQEQKKKNKQITTKKKKTKISKSLWNAQKQFLTTHVTGEEGDNFFSNQTVTPERRAEVWTLQADMGETLVNKYSWATPDPRALRILQEFSPLVEIGCGSNAYWCKCMVEVGINVIGYDISTTHGGQISTAQPKEDRKKNKNKSTTPASSSSTNSQDEFQVRHGGPEVLSSKEIRKSNRTLFLCYPDEDTQDDEQGDLAASASSMGAACLEHYQGQYVIHVGELYGDTISLDQAPWGRSSGSDFQQRLASEYHCILKVGLQNWLHVNDTLSVWKRSEQCSIVFAADSEDEDDDGEDEEVVYVHIPKDEKLPTDIAAPCMEHLLLKDPPLSTDLKVPEKGNNNSNSNSNNNNNNNNNNESNNHKSSTKKKDNLSAKRDPKSKKRKKMQDDSGNYDDDDNSDKSSNDGEYATPW